MASTGKWETVVNKKKSQVTKSDVKRAQQKFVEGEKTPKIEARDPIKLDQTVYAAGFEVKKKHLTENEGEEEKYPSRVPFEKTDDVSTSSPRNQTRKKEKKAHKPTPVFDMASKIKKLDVTMLKAQISEIKSKFPGHSLLWLKEVASWFHFQLTGPLEKGDLAYLNKNADYPANQVPKEVHDVMITLIENCDKNTLTSFFVYLLASLTSEVQQGHATVADRIMIQFLCQVQPHVIIDNCDEVVHGKSRNGDPYLAVIWALSQSTSSIKDGLSVWWSSMFSVLDKKHHGAAAMHYFKRLMENSHNIEIDIPLITPEQMVQLIEVMVGEKSPLIHTPSLMNDLKGCFDQLMKLMLTDTTKEHAKVAFTNMLPALRNQEDDDVKILICEALVNCLIVNNLCLEWWVDNLIHHMRESSVLLKYIQVESDGVNKKLSKQKQYRKKPVLLHVSKRIIHNLDKANEKGRFEKKAGFKDCRKLCSAFIRTEMNRKKESSAVWKVIKFLFIVLLGFAALDVYKSGSYHASTTGFYLKKYCVEEKAKVAFQYTQKATDSLTGYCNEHLPYYYGKVSYYLDPIMETSWKYMTATWTFLYEHSKPVRGYLNEVLPPILDKISYFVIEQARIMSSYISPLYETYYPIATENVSSAYSWLCTVIPEVFNNIVNLIQISKQKIYELSPELFDKISLLMEDFWKYVVETTPLVVDTINEYTRQCVNITRNYVSKGQTWMKEQLSNASPSATK